MIVKDESHIIIDTLKNLCSYIKFDYWVISDTGSSDSTKELIINFFLEKQIPGELVEHKWVDFAHNRTKALECAFNKSDFLFMFDADDSIVGNFKLPVKYDCDSYKCKFGNGFVYVRPLLITNRKKWRFKGVLHEFLENIDDMTTGQTIEGDYHFVSGRSGNRNKNPNKYFDDAVILKEAHFKILATDYGLSCRYAFYCAQSYKDAGEKYMDDAIEWYKKCLTLNMWVQEKFYSCLCIGDLYMKKKDAENALNYWYKTIEHDPERIEGIIHAVTHLRKNGQNLLVNALYHKFKNYKKNLKDKLFLLTSLYNDQFEYENAISAYYINDKESGYECCKKIILNNVIPYNLLKSTISNLNHYKDFLLKDTNENLEQLFYAFDNILCDISLKNETIEGDKITIWTTLFEKIRPILFENKNVGKTLINKDKSKNAKSHSKTIMITFTTCKRLDLFKQTIGSILNHWTDINKIDYWFCVDDNSSENERKEMLKLYPWINFHMKPIKEKGHLKSMNIIWNKLNEIKPKYWIHMEDDFLFHHKTNYIETAIDMLKNDISVTNKVKQVLFNRNYGETISSYNTKGHTNTSNNNIVLHNYCNGTFNYLNCHYWPHYSFRPSLIETDVILKLGNFDSEKQFFEIEYAHKWANAGYTSAFFNRITCQHIGRLTSERNDKNIKNAYDLNNETQFNDDSKKNTDKKIKIINLERRKDRKENIIKVLTDAEIDPSAYEFITATDGKTLKPTKFLKDLFNGNDFGNNRGAIGCAISHYNLWKQLINDKDNEYYLIMEDDFTVSCNFKEKLDKLIHDKCFLEKDILFLGYHMFEKHRQSNFSTYNSVNDEPCKIVELNQELYIGGYFSYSINKSGAKKMLDYIEKNGIKHGIDYLNKIIDNINNSECQPQIVFSEWNEDGKKIDTDIQNMCNAIDLTNIVEENTISNDLINKFTFIPNLDIIGNDIYYHKKEISNLIMIANDDDKCIGFNTLGFFKNKIDVFTPSKYFKESDGFYIKTELYNEYLKKANTKDNKYSTKIKMLCNWDTSEQLCKEWSNMCENNFKWKNYELVWTDVKEDIDYYVIINYPPEDEYYDPKRTIVFQMEPWVYDNSKLWGVKMWGKWANPDPKKFLEVRGCKTDHHNNVQWQIELTPNELNKPELFEKDKGSIISSICSSKYFDEGHIARIDFLKFLEEKGDVLLDIYGQENKHGFKNYRKQLPVKNKSDGYKSYKYYFIMENNFEPNYITEKLWEPILCESLAFYYGCPNVTDYINQDALVLLDVKDFEKSYQIIKRAIKEDLWSQRIDIIRQEKQKILNKMAFFPTIDNIICKDKSQNKTVVCCLVIKNCGKYLNDIFNNLNLLSEQFINFYVICVYDNCNDNSEQLLNEYKNKSKFRVLLYNYNNNNSNFTTVRIANARNMCLDIMNQHFDVDFHFVIDCDDVNVLKWDIDLFKYYLNNDEWDCLSFNRPVYYDIWGLLYGEYKHHCWGFKNDSVNVVNHIRQDITNKLNRLNGYELFECLSAFNGFAIYRTKKFINVRYDGSYAKLKSLISDEERMITLNKLKIEMNNNLLEINNNFIECCEHLYYHISAIKNNNARIRISKKCYFMEK
jgi:GR25 family glycosyltransferase involved in LPS biosynthesis